MDPDFQDAVDMLLDTQGTLEIIGLLKENERALNQLYSLYAVKYPEYSDFWLRIADDEDDHANWISSLYTEVNNNRLSFRKDRFDKSTLESFRNDVLSEIEKLKNNTVPLLEAVSLSSKYEDSMIEKGFFTVFEFDSELLKVTFDKLKASTEAHYQKIKELLEQLEQH